MLLGEPICVDDRDDLLLDDFPGVDKLVFLMSREDVSLREQLEHPPDKLS